MRSQPTLHGGVSREATVNPFNHMRGRREAFARLVRANAIPMATLARRLVDGSEAEDAVQAALTSAWRHFTAPVTLHNPRAWLLRFVVHECSNIVARRLRRPPSFALDLEEGSVMAAKDHRRYILGELGPDFFTHDPRGLAPFFEGQLSARMSPLPSGNGWELEGARVCQFHDTPVGFVTMRYHGIPVSVVDMPRSRALSAQGPELDDDNPCYELLGGRGIWRHTPTGVRVAFGDIEVAKLEEVLQAAH